MSERISQCAAIADALWKGERLTGLAAFKRFGCMRLGGRIYDLRKRGVPIQSRTIDVSGHKQVAEYYISPTDILLRESNQ